MEVRVDDVPPAESGFLLSNPAPGIIRERIDVSQMPTATLMSGKEPDSETSKILRNLRQNLENGFGQPPPSSDASSTSADNDVTMESTLPQALRNLGRNLENLRHPLTTM
jgi:hypothetical protein